MAVREATIINERTVELVKEEPLEETKNAIRVVAESSQLPNSVRAISASSFFEQKKHVPSQRPKW